MEYCIIGLQFCQCRQNSHSYALNLLPSASPTGGRRDGTRGAQVEENLDQWTEIPSSLDIP